jgi:hypothetical protein
VLLLLNLSRKYNRPGLPLTGRGKRSVIIANAWIQMAGMESLKIEAWGDESPTMKPSARIREFGTVQSDEVVVVLGLRTNQRTSDGRCRDQEQPRNLETETY